MAVLKCIVCGGELEISTDMSVAVCKYCDSTITIPKALDRKGNLYNRAVFLRQNNEFDKAVDIYEEILKEDNLDPEAHWGLVLSKFGIEYVSDPKTNERIPTCHRTQHESILLDPDYLAAVDFFDDEAKQIITLEARRIDEIQKRILEISQKEPPYDIFICYKETDEAGNRTEDSILAQDLYYELEKKGYKVFFARKTLESKLGAEYEPIIFAALNSAKVMIVLGTKPENFNAVWVRNEWSRFSKMTNGSNKVIIPAYRGMSPYELPSELSSLQSQDMSKLGFMQDLTNGIDKILNGVNKNDLNTSTDVTNSSYNDNLERLLKNADTYLKLNDYTTSREIYLTITKDHPEDYRGWWGLIICDTTNLTKIAQNQQNIDLWYGYIQKLASNEEMKTVHDNFIVYLNLLAKRDAENDILQSENTLNRNKSNIENFKKKIELLNVEKRDIISVSKTKLEEFDEEERQNNKHLEEINNFIKVDLKHKKFQRVGSWMLLLGIIISIIEITLTEETAIGLVIACIGFCGVLLFSSRKTQDEIEAEMESINKSIKDTLLEKENYQKDTDEQINKCMHECEKIQRNISEIQEQNEKNNDYLNRGIEAISKDFLKNYCEKYNILCDVDGMNIVKEMENAHVN